MMSEKVKNQILGIRATGLTNMFDVIAVLRIANELHYYELVVFVEENRKAYVQFILTGETS